MCILGGEIVDKKILLIADDDDMNRNIIKKFLRHEYEIVEAKDGKETMDILYNQNIDVVLLDIIMPEMDGLEVLERMKKEEKFNHIGVLVATSTKEKTEREALFLGADDIVSKPYDPVVIKKRIENIIAVKTIEGQKEMLQNDDTKTYIAMANKEVVANIDNRVKKIRKYVSIVRANKSNYKLVDEILDNINIELDAAVEEKLE